MSKGQRLEITMATEDEKEYLAYLDGRYGCYGWTLKQYSAFKELVASVRSDAIDANERGEYSIAEYRYMIGDDHHDPVDENWLAEWYVQGYEEITSAYRVWVLPFTAGTAEEREQYIRQCILEKESEDADDEE